MWIRFWSWFCQQRQQCILIVCHKWNPCPSELHDVTMVNLRPDHITGKQLALCATESLGPFPWAGPAAGRALRLYRYGVDDLRLYRSIAEVRQYKH